MDDDSLDTMNSINCSTHEGVHRYWWTYLVTSMTVYLVGLGLSVTAVGMKWVFFDRKNKIQVFNRNSNLSRNANRFKDFFRQRLLGDNLFSKFYIVLNLLCNTIFIVLGILRTYYPVCAEEEYEIARPQSILEIIVAGELVIYAMVRFITSRNIILYWISPYTIVDVITLPHVFLSPPIGIDWIGLRLLRFLWLTEIITVLRFIPFINHDAINIISLLLYFLILWLASSGIVQLLESQGDPWYDFKNGTRRSFFIYAYLIMVTVSTVGYGDIAPKTSSGRIFITFFIIVGLAFFAAMLPRLADVTSSYYRRSQYSFFDTTRVPRHVIVCGHITAVTAEDFLKDFLHPDRGDRKTHILFLHPGKPNAELQNVIRLNYTRVQYLDGSVLNCYDLQKAKIKESLAIFILANKHTFHPTEEDHSNLFRLVSIKNTTIEVPVIIQLLHSFSKNQVYNIEGWNKFTDVAICLNELKLGLLSQSCLCPGFSTLIANLFYTSDFPAQVSFNGDDDETALWKGMYIKGASKEIYSSPFSSYFYQKRFHQAAHTCYNTFSLMILAIESNGKLYVNPSAGAYPGLFIDDSTSGYFIADNKDQVRIVENYNPDNSSVIFRSSTRKRNLRKRPATSSAGRVRKSSNPISVYLKRGRQLALENRNKIGSFSADQVSDPDSADDCCDSREGRRFHIYVSEPSRLEKAILNPDVAFEPTVVKPNVDIRDHIILCMFADENSPLLGLHSFLKPLRSTKLPPELVKPVVIVSNRAYVEKEWAIIRNIPQVYVVVGNPLRWKNLKSARLSKSSVSVMLTVPAGSMDHEQGIIDKEAILCTLSIKNAKRYNKCHRDVQIITDLHQETNVQFLDFGDEDEPDERIYKAQPFACGEAFSSSMFDSVTSAVFHSPGIMQLLENLIHASETNSLCHAVPIDNSGFCNKTFVTFYNSQLVKNSICLGISRKITQEGSQRFVITSPEPELILREGDLAFVITE